MRHTPTQFHLLALTLLSLTACGGSSEPERFALSGAVTFKGQPVPAGYIIFTPDTAQGNAGPGAQANIENGKYTTLTEGTVGGPHRVTIGGYDGVPLNAGTPTANPMGKPLFEPLNLTLDLPRQSSTHDFTLPPQ